jgi:hypothetical protein
MLDLNNNVVPAEVTTILGNRIAAMDAFMTDPARHNQL